MKVLPANQKGWLFHYWSGRYPGRLGHLWSPGGHVTVYPHVTFSFDNGCYAAFSSGRNWNQEAFVEHVLQTVRWKRKPEWLVVPDAPLNPRKTLELWHRWHESLREYGIPLALAVQNGMQPDHLPEGVDWIFVGGDDRWKYETLEDWVSTGLPVHVGRVNGSKLWLCEKLGAKSCDGTGWFRGDQVQLALLERYLQCTAGEAEPPQAGQFSLLETATIHELFLMRQEKIGTFPRQWKNRIPTNISRDHILKAIALWTPVPQQHQPTRYAVEYDGKHYPPKLLISRANLWANGHYWPPKLFSGGQDLNRFIERRGFQIVQFKKELAA